MGVKAMKEELAYWKSRAKSLERIVDLEKALQASEQRQSNIFLYMFAPLLTYVCWLYRVRF